jgi:hypothetical protein
MAGDIATRETMPRLASGAQLWRLNKLGLLADALTVEERVSADRADVILSEAAIQGLWEP